jgi:hypothetical protein
MLLSHAIMPALQMFIIFLTPSDIAFPLFSLSQSLFGSAYRVHSGPLCFCSSLFGRAVVVIVALARRLVQLCMYAAKEDML